MTLEEAIAEIEKLTVERDKLIADKKETIETCKEFIALHPSMFGNVYREVYAKIKSIVEENK